MTANQQTEAEARLLDRILYTPSPADPSEKGTTIATVPEALAIRRFYGVRNGRRVQLFIVNDKGGIDNVTGIVARAMGLRTDHGNNYIQVRGGDEPVSHCTDQIALLLRDLFGYESYSIPTHIL